MSSRAKRLLKLAMKRSSESDHDEFNGGGCVVEFPFIPETKLNAVRNESSALNVVEEQEDHQIKPVEIMSGQHILCGELDQELDQPVVEVERNNNLDNVGPHDSDLTDCKDLGGELDQELDQPDLNTNNKRSRKRKRQPEKW